MPNAPKSFEEAYERAMEVARGNAETARGFRELYEKAKQRADDLRELLDRSVKQTDQVSKQADKFRDLLNQMIKVAKDERLDKEAAERVNSVLSDRIVVLRNMLFIQSDN